jgi:hypothetical protein
MATSLEQRVRQCSSPSELIELMQDLSYIVSLEEDGTLVMIHNPTSIDWNDRTLYKAFRLGNKLMKEEKYVFSDFLVITKGLTILEEGTNVLYAKLLQLEQSDKNF